MADKKEDETSRIRRQLDHNSQIIAREAELRQKQLQNEKRFQRKIANIGLITSLAIGSLGLGVQALNGFLTGSSGDRVRTVDKDLVVESEEKRLYRQLFLGALLEVINPEVNREFLEFVKRAPLSEVSSYDVDSQGNLASPIFDPKEPFSFGIYENISLPSGTIRRPNFEIDYRVKLPESLGPAENPNLRLGIISDRDTKKIKEIMIYADLGSDGNISKKAWQQPLPISKSQRVGAIESFLKPKPSWRLGNRLVGTFQKGQFYGVVQPVWGEMEPTISVNLIS